MATGRRTKRKLKSRPKHRQERALRGRRRKAKKAGQRKAGRNRAKAKRQARSNKLRVR
ncbi:MAG TPA: hypothetical protein VML75_28875 [Kofleriaceae bacterium]|nr:hypothetical protein [Kofleriaceae bacterium]